MTLEERIAALRRGGGDPSDLLSEYLPFITATASKAAGRRIGPGDDELAVALEAFYEAMGSFDGTRGRFLRFAAEVIRRRVIDYGRWRGRRLREVPFSALAGDGDRKPFDAPDDSQLRALALEQEVEALTAALAAWGIGFEAVAAASPRSQKTRRACAAAVRALLADDLAAARLRATGRLPMTELEKISGVPRKTLERHRTYIIAAAEILVNDYPCLREYVSNETGGSKR